MIRNLIEHLRTHKKLPKGMDEDGLYSQLSISIQNGSFDELNFEEMNIVYAFLIKLEFEKALKSDQPKKNVQRLLTEEINRLQKLQK